LQPPGANLRLQERARRRGALGGRPTKAPTKSGERGGLPPSGAAWYVPCTRTPAKTMRGQRPVRSIPRFVADCRGAITTEYAVVVGVCGIVVAAALVALAPPMLASYETSRHTLIAPVP
jgi:Flp pilus assembly pilin Flp